MTLKATDIRKLDDFPEFARPHRAMLGGVHLQRLMNSPPVIEVDVAQQTSAQVALMQDDDVVQTLAAQGADQSLGVRILPRAPRRRGHLFDPQASHTPAEPGAVDAVTITDQLMGCRIERKRFDDVLCGPLSRRVCSDVEMNDPAALVSEDD
jgi:hypothetical protein